MLRISAIIFGLIFVSMGVFGFYPEYTPGGKFFGLIAVSKVDNLVRLVGGITAIFCGIQSAYASKVYFIFIGVLSAAVALYGFIEGPGMHLGLQIKSLADLWLLTIVAVIALFFGLLFQQEGR